MVTRRWAVLMLLSLSLASCGEAAQETAVRPSDLQAYCKAVLKAATLPGGPGEEEGHGVKTWTRDTQLPAFEDIANSAPERIKEDIDLQLDEIRETAETGRTFPSREVLAARDRSMAFDHANCDWEKVEMTATEYDLGGIPSELEVGATSFRVRNTGKVEHDFAVRRIDEDLSESLSEILKEEEKFFRAGKMDALGGFGARPGTTSYALFDLTPGRYGLACFAPVGGEEGAERHWRRGEFAEFTVN